MICRPGKSSELETNEYAVVRAESGLKVIRINTINRAAKKRSRKNSRTSTGKDEKEPAKEIENEQPEKKTWENSKAERRKCCKVEKETSKSSKRRSENWAQDVLVFFIVFSPAVM